MKPLINPFIFAQSLFQEKGSWTVAVIETSIFWPPQIQAVEYEGKYFILMPYEQTQGAPTPTLPAIALKSDTYNLSGDSAKKVILEFASALAWLEGGKLEVVHWTGGDRPRSMGIMRNNGISNYLDPEHIPQYLSDNAKTALAFFREGISLENPFYSFFSLYKAFTIAISDKKHRGVWMNANKGNIDDHLAIKRLNELEFEGCDVGEYLYSGCRHAIVHADEEPFVNPDLSEDLIEISKNLSLIRNYVELALEESFGIKRLKIIYKEHLYELNGFKDIVDSEVYSTLKAGGVLGQDLTFNIPDNLRFVARRNQDFYVLEPFNADAYSLIEGDVILQFRSTNKLIKIRIYLDFQNEKLRFDPLRDFDIVSNRSDHTEINYEITTLEFKRCILSNGVLEIWDTNHRLGCSGAYVPINAMVNFKYFEDQINELKGMIK